MSRAFNYDAAYGEFGIFLTRGAGSYRIAPNFRECMSVIRVERGPQATPEVGPRTTLLTTNNSVYAPLARIA